jgi:hypothetical protein
MSPNPLRLCVVVCLAIATHVHAGDEPCTLYKPANIAIAKANIERYDWAKRLLASYRKTAKGLLKHDREFFRNIVPDLTPGSTYGQVCPACVNRQCSMGETGVWQWYINDPDKIRCKYCKTEYPNEKYPENGRLDCPRMGQSFTYYLNSEQQAHPDEEPGKYAYLWAGRPVQVSFSGVIRSEKVQWALAQPTLLSELYALTDETPYAERAAWILERLAEVYEKYLYHSYGGCFADMDPTEVAREMGRHPPAGKFAPGVICHPAKRMRQRLKDGSGALDAGFWGAGRFTTGAGGEGGALLRITVAYDLTRDARYPDGRPVYSPKAAQRVERLIQSGCADMENYAAINNKCGPGRALSGAVGMLFQQPDRVRRAIAGIESLLDECFHFDGFCKESPGYSNMHLSLMGEIPDLLCGYSDPPGYQPAEGSRLDRFDPYRHLTRYRLALEDMPRLLRPDRKYPVLGDTQDGTGLSTEFVEILADHCGPQYARLLETVQGAPLDKKGSRYALWNRPPDLKASADGQELPLRTEYFPGWQVGVLRSNNDASKTAFYFNGYAAHGHRHNDTLGIVYHAVGQELASDRGYIWDDPRNAWTKSTESHNLVTVDGKSQEGKGRHSTLELFAATPGVEVIQASANAYQQCSEYRRTCALVRLPQGGNYVVDFFRVQGGTRHQYGINCNGSFLGLEGLKAAPIQEEHKWLANFLAADRPPASWSAAWEHRDIRFRFWMLGQLDRLLVVDAPGWRSYRGDQLHAPPITQLLAQRNGRSDLQSVYSAVLEPYQGSQGPIRKVELISPSPASDKAVALAVHRDGAVDYVISSLDDEPRTYGPVRVAGRFALATVDLSGRLQRAMLLEGKELNCAQQRIQASQARAVSKIAKVDGRCVELAQPLPAEMVRPGMYVRSGETAFAVEEVDGTRVVIRDFPFEAGKEITASNAMWFSQEAKRP